MFSRSTRWLIATLAVVSCALLASAIPAFATPLPRDPQPDGGAYFTGHPVRPMRSVTALAVGMPGWEIAVIAIGAALVAAVAAVLAYRALAARRPARLTAA